MRFMFLLLQSVMPLLLFKNGTVRTVSTGIYPENPICTHYTVVRKTVQAEAMPKKMRISFFVRQKRPRAIRRYRRTPFGLFC